MRLIEQWSGPAGFLVLFGAIVWGIQLNMAVLGLTKGEMAIAKELSEMTKAAHLSSENMIKVSVLLESLTERVEQNSSAIAKHNEEAEAWKRKISVIEDRSER